VRASPFVRSVAWFVLAFVCSGAIAADRLTEDRERTYEALNRAKAESLGIAGQVKILIGLAWPADPDADPVLRAAARADLVSYGAYSLNGLREAVKTIDPIFRADATAAMIEAWRSDPSGSPPDYWPGLEEAIWFGTVESKRLGMIELSNYPFPPGVLTIIDAVYEYPELALPALRALNRMRNDRARNFLKRVLMFTGPPYRNLAADAIAALGDPIGVPILRDAARSEQRDVREVSMAAFLPWAVTDDLTMLYEYLEQHPKDDPAVLEAIKEKALELEAKLAEGYGN